MVYKAALNGEMIEPVPVDDVFTSGLGDVEDMGCNWRLTFFVVGKINPSVPPTLVPIVRAKLIIPAVAGRIMAEMIASQKGCPLGEHFANRLAC